MSDSTQFPFISQDDLVAHFYVFVDFRFSGKVRHYYTKLARYFNIL